QTLWMTALHRAGRRSEAIEVFDAAREALAVLDLEPDRELLAARAMVLEQPAAQRGGTARDAAPSVELDEGEIRRDLAQPGAPELTLRARRRLARVLAMKGRFDEALELFGQIEAQYRARSQEDDEATALGDLAAVVSVTGDLSRALRYLDEAEQLEERTASTDAFLRLQRALLLTHAGRIEQGAESVREVPRRPEEPVPPGSEPAVQLAAMWWRVLSQVDRRRGATGPAVAAARRAFHLAARGEPQLDPGPVLGELASSLSDAGGGACFEWFQRAIHARHAHGRMPRAA